MALHPWKPGQSGNPGGRPKSRVLTEAMLKELVKREAKRGPTYAERIGQTAVRQAAAGDVAWAKLLCSYVEGLPVQAIEHSGPDGTAFTLTIVRPDGSSDPPA